MGRDIWSFSRLSLQKGEDLDSLNFIFPKPSKRHIFEGKAFCFSPSNTKRYNEIINWCQSRLSECLISADIDNNMSLIIWIPNNKDVILFKLTFIRHDPYLVFHEQMRELGLLE